MFPPTVILHPSEPGRETRGIEGFSEQSKLTEDGLTNNLPAPVAHIWTKVSRLGGAASP